MNNVQQQWEPYSGWCGALPARLLEPDTPPATTPAPCARQPFYKRAGHTNSAMAARLSTIRRKFSSTPAKAIH
jgi:hypothetical protein